MSKTEKATKQMESWAQDSSHGYDQDYRWGEKEILTVLQR